MEKCEHCGMNFINKACVTKHLRNGKCPKYIPPKTYEELQAENERLTKLIESQGNDIEHFTSTLMERDDEIKRLREVLEYVADCQDCLDLGSEACKQNEYCVSMVARKALQGESDG